MGTSNYGVPAPPVPTLPSQSKSNATTILVLGILSVVCCQILGPVAWYMGNKELQAIRAGLMPTSGESSAKAGMILGIIGTVFLGLTFIWLLLGGMAVVTGILQQQSW